MTESPAGSTRPGRPRPDAVPVALRGPGLRARRSSTCSARSRTARSRRSSGSPRTPGWRPTLRDKAELARMAATEFGHFERAARPPRARSAPTRWRRWRRSRTPFDAFHARTRLVGLARGAGHGVRRGRAGRGLLHRDRGVPRRGHPDRRSWRASTTPGSSEFVVDRVRAAIAADHRVGGRLALWGRRLMGEALTQAQRVAAERDALTALLAGGVDRPGMDLAAIGRLFTRLTENHTKRHGDPRPRAVARSRSGSGGRRLGATTLGARGAGESPVRRCRISVAGSWCGR